MAAAAKRVVRVEVDSHDTKHNNKKWENNSGSALFHQQFVYITSMSTRKLYDEYGNTHMYVDEGLKRQIETKLITAIVAFAA